MTTVFDGPRRVLPPAVAVLAAVSLAACQSHAKVSGTGSSASASVSSSPEASSSASASGLPGGQPSGSVGAPAGGSGSGGVRRCATAGLKVEVQGDPGLSGAGHYGEVILFTNVSGSACTMYGFPGVSYVSGPSGGRIGDPAQRSKSPVEVVVAAGVTARAVLYETRTGVYDPEQCKPVEPAGILVYPPDETAAVYVATPGHEPVCSVGGVNTPLIEPVQLGTGQDGS